MDDQASPDEYGDHVSDAESFQDDHDIKEESNTSPSATSNTTGRSASATKNAVHLQKRRRVTRACDECRRKKIKCDGKQPCTHCTVYSYECTYDQPSNRRRNPAPQYVENLEHRVHRAESLLHILIPNLDLNDPGIDAAVQQGWIPGAPGKGAPTTLPDAKLPRPIATSINGTKPDTNIESMVRAVAQLDLDETGHWDYHGHSSGLSFVRRMREQLGDLMGPETVSTPFVKSRPMSQVLDSPKSIDSPLGDFPTTGNELPPREVAVQLCGNALNDAAALLRIVHQPTFWQSLDRIYSTPMDHFTNEENRFMPLLYSAMALGSLFGKDEQGSVIREGYETGIQQGFAYFKIARQMMDITDCRDLSSIQAVVCMVLFLQSSAKLSQCYAYVGVALRASLRMGLHRSAAGKFNPIEQEMRKRTFWAVRKLDIYVGTMIGLPLTLMDEDIDQEFPMEVDDEYITQDGILPQPEGVVSLLTAFNHHTRLVQILAKVVRLVYPIKAQDFQAGGDKTYSVPISVIREIENDLEQWKNSLPAILSPCEAPARYTRIQQLLRLAYAHAQVMLYRPFLHFVAMEKRSKPVDQRAYACAASFVNVSRNIIHITIQMKQKNLLNGAHWFIMYTTFFSVLALVYFAAENPDNATTGAVMKDAIDGKEVLASLAKRSLAADRCTATLDGVFQRLPQWMREGKQNPAATRKRPFSNSAHLDGGNYASPQASRSHPDISITQHDPKQGTKRASTHPNMSQLTSGGAQSPFTSTWAQPPYGMNATSGGSFESYGGLGSKSTSNKVNGGMQYPVPSNFANPALADMSTIMFPTADEPFIYPNQPLTTFESNNQQYNNPNAFLNGQSFGNVNDSVATQTSPSLGRDENIEAQFYALPPYIEQRQPNQVQQGRQPNMPFSQPMQYGGGQNTPTAAPPGGFPMVNGNWGGPRGFPQDMSNINIHEIFGGAEWNPVVMPAGYQQ